MDFALDETQQALVDGADRFLRDHYGFDQRRLRLAGQTGTDRAMWARFAELGWPAVLVPEAQGGLGWSATAAALILGECGKALVAEPVLEGAMVAAALLGGSPSPAAAAALAGIADGSALVVPALLESGGRYAYDRPATRAERTGAGWRLSGRKILVTGGDAADALLVTARYDGGLGVFLVPTNRPGLARIPLRQLDGSWAADIALDAVSVGADALLDTRGTFDQALDLGAIGVAAQQVGSLDRVLALTADYLGTRRQFGQPLAGFQSLQHAMADLFVETEMARSALHGGLAAMAGAPEERRLAVSAARVRCDRAGLKVADLGIYLHGGMGMTMEYPVGHHYRRMVQLARSFGDSEYHLARYEALAFAEA
ncbi:MAG TPA: acyl-CoA dehydrogenase [Novosphingobium sp.]